MPSYFPKNVAGFVSLWPDASDDHPLLLRLESQYAARHESRQQAVEAQQKQQAQMQEGERAIIARRTAVKAAAVLLDPINTRAKAGSKKLSQPRSDIAWKKSFNSQENT